MMGSMAEMIDLPLYEDSPRFSTSARFASIAWEHWIAVLALSEDGLHASATCLLRIQFETLVRSVWCLHCASDALIGKLDAPLSPESEQGAKGLPQASEMLAALEKKPETSNLHVRLAEFKNSSWKALNSYVHAGIHPLHRHTRGHPTPLILQTVRVSNGLGLMTAIQRGLLTGRQELQSALLGLCRRYPDCLPPEDPPTGSPDRR